MLEKQTVLRQLEAILHVHKLSRSNHDVDALREVTRLSFLPLDPRRSDGPHDAFQKLSPHVQACIPDLLKVVLNSLDNVRDTDGTLRAMKAKVCRIKDRDFGETSVFLISGFLFGPLFFFLLNPNS